MPSIYGTVGRIIHKGDNFFVLSFEVDHSEPATSKGRNVTVTGSLYGLREVSTGITIQFVGDWVTHPKYGRQFRMYGWFPYVTHDYGVQRFLSECIHGFEDIQVVEKIVNTFGTETYEMLTSAHGEVMALFPDNDLKNVVAQNALFSWTEACSLNNLSIFLKDYELSEEVIRNIFARFGMEAITLIADNPYRLVAVDGFDFSKADRLASRIGIPMTDPRRYDGAVFWVLKTEAQQGHLFVRRADFAERLRDILMSDTTGFESKNLQENLASAILRLEETHSVRVDPNVGVYLPEMYLYERDGARKLASFMTPSKIEIDIHGFIEQYERGNHIQFSDAQRYAITKLIDNHVVAVTGLPGTGKTTLIRAAVRLFKQTGISFLLMAPTGIAAKRLSAVTGEPASTIHRAFGWTGKSWEFSARNKYSVGAVIVDEMSMVDQELFYRILDALHPSTLLILVGDDAQLPSVGPGNVLRELLSSSAIPHVRLTQVFRQSEQSAIVLAAHRVYKGESPQLDNRKPEEEFQFVKVGDEDKIVGLVVAMAVKLKSRDANFQVLSPKYDGTVGVHNLNQALREKLNPLTELSREYKAGKTTFRTGDRVMVVKNDYSLNVSNGDMGKLRNIERDHLCVQIHGVGPGSVDTYVNIPKERAATMLRLAYVITVHKSQGSEFDTIIMPVVRGQGRMLQRNLFYTAITRAKKKVWLLGESTAILRAIANDKVVQRNTFFAPSINEAVEDVIAGVVRAL
jgi:exodeoxyribonuclease V alpha subunit